MRTATATPTPMPAAAPAVKPPVPAAVEVGAGVVEVAVVESDSTVLLALLTLLDIAVCARSSSCQVVWSMREGGIYTHWRADRHAHREKRAPGIDDLCSCERAESSEYFGRVTTSSRNHIRVNRFRPGPELCVCYRESGGRALDRPIRCAGERGGIEVSVNGVVIASIIVCSGPSIRCNNERQAFRARCSVGPYVGQQVVMSTSTQA